MLENANAVELLGTVLFGVAILHTFLVKRFELLAHRFRPGSFGENVCHILSEVEAVMLLWAGVFFVGYIGLSGWENAVHYVEHDLQFTEPKFVVAIMAVAATAPVIRFAEILVKAIAMILPLPRAMAFLLAAITMGPLLGSFITEPAAMTVTALLLKKQFFDRGVSTKFMYAMLGVLFVNVSIGGTMTNFAAPPVLMVAHKWGWDTSFMFMNVGWKAALAVLLNAVGLLVVFSGQLMRFSLENGESHDKDEGPLPAPWWVIAVHLATLGFIVIGSHHEAVFVGVFVFFLGWLAATHEYQEALKLREAFLVGGFLAGLVTLGGVQSWWLQPLLASMTEVPLYLGTGALTAITDNAALTYLGSQVELSESMKLALVKGAVVGGGLTVIANAPNPAGFSILKGSFSNGISPLGLLAGAALPTVIAVLCLWF